MSRSVKRYCDKCGSEMELVQVRVNRYKLMSGEPIWKAYFRCPKKKNFLDGHKTIHGLYDEVQDIFDSYDSNF